MERRVRNVAALLMVASSATSLASYNLWRHLSAERPVWRVVFTPSVPRGLYREVEPGWKRGSLLEFCLCSSVGNLARTRGYVARGDCPGGVRPVVKVVAGVGGDVVQVGVWDIRINGDALRLSDRQTVDGQGRPVPRVGEGRLVLGEDELWLHSSEHPRGLDSRLCGPVSRWQVVTGLKPIWTEDWRR